MDEIYIPEWYLGNGRIDEVAFAGHFLEGRELICVNRTFFTKEGMVTDVGELKKEIYDELEPFLTSNVSKKVDSILELLRLRCRENPLPIHEDWIHVSNGTYNLWNGFSEHKAFCRNRLPVIFSENLPEPEQWLKFVNELLEPEDVLTLQEYLGYCLVPTTAAQKMLIITGNGGEGKSRIGIVMKAILGDSMAMGSLSKVETNAFARADLENILLFVDDDLKLEALPQTNHIKSIVTAEGPMDLERKGLQSYQGRLYSRFLAFGNESLQALHDRSYGFFRRQIILSAKPRPQDRVDDPYLAKKLVRERDSIFLWALSGLMRLKGNNYRFTISQRTEANMKEVMTQGNNLLSFVKSEGYFRFDQEGSVSSRALYQCYREWCEDNSLNPLSSKSFSTAMNQNAHLWNIRPSNHIPIGNGRQARGYHGIRLVSRF